MNCLKSYALPLLLDVQGSPYLIDPDSVDFGPGGVPLPENIYPELAPCWDGAAVYVEVDDGEIIVILGRRFQVNQIGGLELVALATASEAAEAAEEADPMGAWTDGTRGALD